MTITIMDNDLEVLSSSAVESTPAFSTGARYELNSGDKIHDGDSVYTASKDFSVIDFKSVAALDTYAIGQVYYSFSIEFHNHLNYSVTAMEGDVPKQPQEYDNVTTDPDHTSWTNERFLLIHYSPYIFHVGDIEYKFEPNGDMVYVTITSASLGINDKFTLANISLITELHEIRGIIPANIHNANETDYWLPQWCLVSENGIYVRTHIDDTDAPAERIVTNGVPVFTPTNTAADVPALLWYGYVNSHKILDNKNYTKTIGHSGGINFEVRCNNDFNMLTMGYVLAEEYTYWVYDDGGTEVETGDGVIDGRRDVNGVMPSWYTTIPVYLNTKYPAGYSVEMRMRTNTGQVEIGTFSVGIAVDMGFTNLTLQNTSKDFSVFEYDPWGNAEYLERARVSIYNGTADVPIEKYDIVDRFFTSLGKKIIMLDGSDAINNETPDSKNVFAATQKIGRITAFKQNTKVKYNDIDEYFLYSFTLEEIV